MQQRRSEQDLGYPVLCYKLGNGARCEHDIIGNYVHRSPLQKRPEELPGKEDIAGDPVSGTVGTEPAPRHVG